MPRKSVPSAPFNFVVFVKITVCLLYEEYAGICAREREFRL